MPLNKETKTKKHFRLFSNVYILLLTRNKKEDELYIYPVDRKKETLFHK